MGVRANTAVKRGWLRLVPSTSLQGVVLKSINLAHVPVYKGLKMVGLLEPPSGACKVKNEHVAEWKAESLVAALWQVKQADGAQVNMEQTKLKSGPFTVMGFENSKAIKPFDALCIAHAVPVAPAAKKQKA